MTRLLATYFYGEIAKIWKRTFVGSRRESVGEKKTNQKNLWIVWNDHGVGEGGNQFDICPIVCAVGHV